VGQHPAFAFSRTSSLSIEGEKESATRISGTSQYTVIRLGPDEASLSTIYRFDGSSILYNRLMSGAPPAKFRAGTSWISTIGQSWELGPKGTQTVTVVALSDGGHQVTPRREGSGVGEGLDGKRTVIIKRDGKDIAAEVQYLKTTWSGYSVYRDGLLVSDILVANSEIMVVSAEFAPTHGSARQYVLMNAMPPGFNG
jgi:hypothetical protein